MKLLQLLALTFLLTACGQNSNIDPELQPFVVSFLSDASSFGQHPSTKNLDVLFGDLEGKLGLCKREKSGNPFEPEKQTITIDQDFWDRSTDASKEFVLYHELGHCVLNRNHSKSSNYLYIRMMTVSTKVIRLNMINRGILVKCLFAI